nr:hypothetical protein [Tanacetum cinerariifolium]
MVLAPGQPIPYGDRTATILIGRSSDYVTDLEDSSVKRFEPFRSRETKLEMDVDVVRSDGIVIAGFPPPFLTKASFFKKEEAGKKKRKARNDQYNRCSKKLSRVVSPTRLECIAGH